MSIIQGAKAVAEIASTHKDVLVKTGQVGAQEVMKKKSKDEAKVRYADYLAYKTVMNQMWRSSPMTGRRQQAGIGIP